MMKICSGGVWRVFWDGKGERIRGSDIEGD